MKFAPTYVDPQALLWYFTATFPSEKFLGTHSKVKSKFTTVA